MGTFIVVNGETFDYTLILYFLRKILILDQDFQNHHNMQNYHKVYFKIYNNQTILQYNILK